MEDTLRLEDSSDVAAIRESAISAIADTIDIQGDIAQGLAAELYDAICLTEGIESKPAEIFDGVIDRDMMVEKVHYYARDIVAGMREKFDRECADLAEYYVRRCAYENTVRNCDANDVRYARIPTGEETCEFCFMLASRGFVYHSEAKAKGAHGVHQNCDCIVMPGVNGKTEIHGYDWRGMHDRWLKCQATAGVQDGESFDGRHATLKEVATRDPRWLFSGTPTPIDYSEKPRSTYGEVINDQLPIPRKYALANITGKDNEKKDVFVHDMLSGNGFRVQVHETIENGGFTNIDLDLNGNRCEVKSPEAKRNPGSKDELKFVQRNVQAARHQFAKEVSRCESRMVMSNYYTEFEGEKEELVIDRYRKELNLQGFTEGLFIRKDGSIVRVK